MFRIIVALAASTIAASASAGTPLWQKADSGMSQAQVAAAFPDAAAPAKVTTLGDGARCELAIEHYDVNHSDFHVCFFFGKAGLQQVTLGSGDPSEAQFESMIELLRSKYGTELGAGQRPCKGALLYECQAGWSLPTGANISMLYMTIGGDDPLLNINYQVRLATEASKL